MKVLVACERSGIVRKAFNAFSGVQAFSCDTEPCEDGRVDFHIQRDAVEVAHSQPWDLMIAHPPCTYLCISGIHWNNRIAGRREKTAAAIEFVRQLMDAPIRHKALENPVGVLTKAIGRWSQKIQPWQFGHPYSKLTCLWLENLPLLTPTNVLTPEAFQTNGSPRWRNQTATGQNKLGPSDTRVMDRARTYLGIAQAMAAQWTHHLFNS